MSLVNNRPSTIQFRRGVAANLSGAYGVEGEPLYVTDTETLYIVGASGTKILIGPTGLTGITGPTGPIILASYGRCNWPNWGLEALRARALRAIPARYWVTGTLAVQQAIQAIQAIPALRAIPVLRVLPVQRALQVIPDLRVLPVRPVP